MKRQRKSVHARKDHSEKKPHPIKIERNKEWQEPLDGIFSDSEVGGEAKSQQNPWQGPQERWEQP